MLGKGSCFGADAAAELEGEGRRCGVLTQWVRLHSCTLNNLGIAHRTPPPEPAQLLVTSHQTAFCQEEL